MATANRPAPQPATAAGPVGDPGSVMDHVFRLADALRQGQWRAAYDIAVDTFGLLNDPGVAHQGAVPMAAAPTNANDLANRLEELAGRHGGRRGMAKAQAQAAAITVDWSALWKQLVPILLQVLMTIFQQPGPTPGPTPVQPIAPAQQG
jgi:hypothetical protein